MDSFRWYKIFSPVWLAELCTFYGGGKGDSPAAPDYSQIAAASAEAARLGNELGHAQLDEAKRQYDQNYATAKPIIDAQTALAQQQTAQGNDYYNYMKQYSRPVEESLWYQSMGFTPDEIQQIQDSRASETKAAQDQAAQDAAKAAATPTSISIPTTTAKTTYAPGAISGKDLAGKTIITGYGPDQSILGGSATVKGAPITGKADPNLYYIKNADGSYSVSQPKQELVNGTTQVQIPGTAASAASTGITSTPQTDALIQKLAAGAAIRQQNEAADTAIADSRKGFTDANNMAIRTGLRYGLSSDKIAAGLADNETQQAQVQAAAASGARSQAKSLNTAQKLDVAGLYRGLPGASQAAYGLTINAGNSAVNNQMAPGNAYMSGMTAGNSTIMQGQGLQLQGLGNIINSQTSAYNAANQNDGGWGALGNVIGMGLSKWKGWGTP